MSLMLFYLVSSQGELVTASKKNSDFYHCMVACQICVQPFY